MFMINEQENTKLKFGDETEKPAAGTENLVRAAQQKGISSIQKKFDSKLGGFIQSMVPDSISKNLISGFTDTIGGLKLDTTGRVKHNPTVQASRVEDKESTIVVDKLPTTRLDTVINMYITNYQSFLWYLNTQIQQWVLVAIGIREYSWSMLD